LIFHILICFYKGTYFILHSQIRDIFIFYAGVRRYRALSACAPFAAAKWCRAARTTAGSVAVYGGGGAVYSWRFKRGKGTL
jgi:hypothetical protein